MPGGRAASHTWRVTTDFGPGRYGAPRWLRPQVWAALLIVAAIGIAVLLTGCGGSSSPPTSAQSKNYQKALAFVQCMRTHGQPTFPDPTSQGIVSDAQANITPGILASFQQCRTLLPPGLLQLTEAQREQLTTEALRRAQCMRAHGVPNFPDPGSHPPPGSLDPNSPVFQAAARRCLEPTGPGRAGVKQVKNGG
jgi:hypothetical protein